MQLRYHHPDPHDPPTGPSGPSGSAGAPAGSTAGGGVRGQGGGSGPSDQSGSPASGTPPVAGTPVIGTPGSTARRGRLSLMLTYGGWRDGDFAEQLPALLGPLGIDCHRCRSGVEATEFLRRASVHIAIVDLSIPMELGPDRHTPAGPRVLQLLRRLDQPPPTVVVRPPQPNNRDSARGLSEALRDGAFAVIDGPVRLESMLETLRRVVRRHYRDHWPAA